MSGSTTTPFAQRSGPGGAVVLCSPLLERPRLRHGFATRLGGVSEGTLSSLNFGLKGGDPPGNVCENLCRLGWSVGFEPKRFYRLQQVHGREVLHVKDGVRPAALLEVQGDALITDEPGVTVGVVTADCVPVLFADPARPAVGAAHAGWRGLAAGVLEATVAALHAELGSSPRQLLCAIGPCIGPCCYEVGEEVAACFEEGAVHRGGGPRPYLDLVSAARSRLLAAGIPEAQISAAGLCTRCRADLFFSYRRDGVATGHHLSVIGISTRGGDGIPRRS